ncbi:MAG: methionyl-tRNA formyltransferase [Patescibacteria group bacterium]|nr:methionyl-tRNA formyltransferase [Actinomycetota bacterium]MCL5970271.1 methionyl-tRNA formyltransferase [Patescibacteria group bacterium]
MNIVFFGSSKYSVIVEKALFEKFGLSLVVTIPDKPVGRKQILTPSPVKKFAVDNNIPVLTFDKLDENSLEKIKEYNPDFLVVADYGLILPDKLLELPKYAPLNIHHSLLPKYRGPSPAPTAILNGDEVTGVTVIKMSEQMDTGDILAQEKYELSPNETTDSLLTKLNELGASLVINVIENYEKIKPVPQDESKAVYTKKMEKKDGYFDITNPPSFEELDKMIRAYYPWPNAWSKIKIRNQELRIKFLPNKMIQVEGKNPMNIKDFINGYPEVRNKILPILQISNTTNQ